MENNIRSIIEANGVKITFICEKAGLSRKTFYEIMNGNAVPSLVNARKISQVLGQPLEKIFPNDKFEG